MCRVALIDSYNTTLFTSQIDLTSEEIKDYKNMGVDIWIRQDETLDARGSPREDVPKLRIRLHYSYSDRVRYSSMVREWQTEILSDFENLTKVEQFLDDMQKPFNFLKVVTSDDAPDLNDEDLEDLDQQANGDNQYHE